MKILILGYSKIVRKRIFKVFLNKKNKIFIATKSYKKKISGIEKKYNNYEKALKTCKPDLVYISLPNSKHYFWAKKSLEHKCHTIVDKPITRKLNELKKLIKISKINKKLLAESTFFNYHSQIKKIKKIFNNNKYKNIEAKFCIPMPVKNSILRSKKLCGGVLMDMGPYLSSIPRIFNLNNIIDKKILIKKNLDKIIISINFLIKFNEGNYKGRFVFGEKYINKLEIKDNSKSAIITRVFSPPDDQVLYLKFRQNNKLTKFKFKKENCFKNFYNEFIIKIKKKNLIFIIKE